MQIEHVKTDCQLTTPRGETLSAFVHLIEVHYSDRVVFWNAVLQVTLDQVAKLDNMEAVIMLRLPDGRDAGMHVTHGHATGGYFELAGVGTPNTTRAVPAQRPLSKEPNGLLAGNKSVLTFNLNAESVNIGPQGGRSPWQLMNKLNDKPWIGKDRGSCRVIDIQQKEPVPMGATAMMDHAEFVVRVGYRPEGWISGVKNDGRDRLNGWCLEIRDQKNDGTLLDGDGQPLPPGAEPVFLRHEMSDYADFNDYDFGHFVGEE